MKSQKFSRRSLRLQALMMGSQFDIDTIFDPNAKTASVKWDPSNPLKKKQIVLPTLAHSGSDEDAELLEGLFDHEVGHCRFSDFSVIEKVSKLLGAIGQRLHNSIEDVYEEKQMGEVFPGCKRSLRRVEEIFIKRDMYSHNTDLDPANALNIGIYSMLRMNVLKHPSEEVFAAVQPQMVKHFGQELTDKVLQISAGVSSAKSTEDTAIITTAIIDLVKDSIKESQQNQQQQSPQQGGQPGQGNPSSGGQPGSGTPDPSGQQSGSGNPTSGGQPSPVGNLTQGQMDALQAALDAKLEDIKDISIDSNAVKALDENGALSKGGCSSNSAGSVHDVGVHGGESDADWRRDAANSAQPLFVRMGSKLEMLLESIKHESEWTASNGRKVVKDYAEKIDSGNFKVFRRREDSDEINTATAFLVDFSGSMDVAFDGTSRIGAAWEACFAAGKVMHQHDIPYSVTGFAADVCHLKSFEESPSYIRKPNGRDSATMTHEGVMAAGFPLLTRSEEKKLLIIITDGLPASRDSAAANISELQRYGIHVAVVFINNDEGGIKAFGDELIAAGCTYALAKTRDDLSGAVFSAVKQSMHV